MKYPGEYQKKMSPDATYVHVTESLWWVTDDALRDKVRIAVWNIKEVVRERLNGEF